MRQSTSLLIDLLICLRFATRLPVPILAAESAPHAPTRFPHALRLLPAAGAVIGALAAGALAVGAALGFPPLLSAPIAVGVLILLSGALHEDGLADCADGFGGGATRERKLEIMDDSRIGAFGALALALALYLRVAAVATLASRSLGLASAVLIGTAALSRGAALLPLILLAPARRGGAGFAAGKPRPEAQRVAFLLACLFGFAPILAGAGAGRAMFAMIAVLGAALAFTAFARREIGGQTGDVAGATQQLTEIAVYLVYAAGN